MGGQDGLGGVGAIARLCDFGQGFSQGEVAGNAVIAAIAGDHQSGYGVDAVGAKRFGINLDTAPLVFVNEAQDSIGGLAHVPLHHAAQGGGDAERICIQDEALEPLLGDGEGDKVQGLRRGFGLLRPLARKLVGPLAVLGLLTLPGCLRERSGFLYLLGGGRVGNQLVNKALGIGGAHVAGLAWHGQQGAQGAKQIGSHRRLLTKKHSCVCATADSRSSFGHWACCGRYPSGWWYGQRGGTPPHRGVC